MDEQRLFATGTTPPIRRVSAEPSTVAEAIEAAARVADERESKARREAVERQLPFEISKWLSTISAHCTVLCDGDVPAAEIAWVVNSNLADLAEAVVAALAPGVSTSDAPAQPAPSGWLPIASAPRGIPIWALHPAHNIPGGWWAATVILGDDTDENPFDTILHYNGQTLLASFRGVFRYWQPIAAPPPPHPAQAESARREIASAVVDKLAPVLEAAQARIRQLSDAIAASRAEVERERDKTHEWANAFTRVVTANPGFEWHEYPDGITADDAAAFLIEDTSEAWRFAESQKARADASLRREDALAGALSKAKDQLRIADANLDGVCMDMSESPVLKTRLGDWQLIQATGERIIEAASVIDGALATHAASKGGA